MQHHTTRRFLATFVVALGVIGSAQAEVYRWVDENGVVNFSQHKPEGRAARSVDPRGSKPARRPVDPASSAEEASQPKLSENQQQMLNELKAREAERQAQLAEIRRDNCEKSRNLLQRLTATARIRVRGEDGQERVLPDEELQARISEAQEGIATNCDSIASG